MFDEKESPERLHQQLVMRLAREAGALVRQEGLTVPVAIARILSGPEISGRLIMSREQTTRDVASVLGQRGQRGQMARRELDAWRKEDGDPKKDAQELLDQDAARAGFASGEEVDKFLRE